MVTSEIIHILYEYKKELIMLAKKRLIACSAFGVVLPLIGDASMDSNSSQTATQVTSSQVLSEPSASTNTAGIQVIEGTLLACGRICSSRV